MHVAPSRLIAALLVFVPLVQAGLNRETGSYVFTHYSAKDYGASPQNWAIAQDRSGIMYFGNTDGLMQYDGAAWRLLRLPNRSIVRSVSIDSNGTVYVGAQGDFGFLDHDDHGNIRYVSLLNRLPEPDRHFADVWRILPTPEGTYFSTVSRLFRLNADGTLRIWKPEKKFSRAFRALDSLYVVDVTKGLMRLQGDELKLAPGGEQFSNDVVNAAVPLETNSALIATTTKLYRLKRDLIEAFSNSAKAELASSSIYSMLTMPGGEIAIGTRTGGLYLLDSNGNTDRLLSKANGLADDFLLAIYADRQGGVWLAQQSGITRFNPGLSRFDTRMGLQGDVESIARHQGSLFVGTTAGLFRMSSAVGQTPHFERVGELNKTVWALVSTPSELLAATDLGIYSSGAAGEKQIYNIPRGVWDIALSLNEPDVMYAASGTAVSMLRRSDTEWHVVSEVSIPGGEVRSVVQDKDGQLWAASKGRIWRISFSAAGAQTQEFGLAQGVPPGWINARRIKDHIVFATTGGLRQYSPQARRLVPDSTFGKQFSDGSRDVFNLFEDPSGNFWITGENYHGIMKKESTGYRWYPMPLLHSGIQEIYAMSIDSDGIPWAAGADYILHRWDPRLEGEPDKDFRVLTRSAQVAGSKDYLYGGFGPFNPVSLLYRQNALRFEFAAPFFELPGSVEYQILLEGSDSAWSEWSKETHKDYNNLSEGSYRFHVRARNPHAVLAEQEDATFSVLPPWYRTWWAYVIYAISGGFGVWGIVRWRTRKLIEEKHQLEAIVVERTVEIREQRDEIQLQEQKSQALLLNILPATVADELKSTGTVEPVGFDDVTVCFTDFVGFTLSSEKLQPRKLVDSLNEYFTAFDEIIARYGLEKLKTIGDSYMFASGLPLTRQSHAVDAVLAAMEMVAVVKSLSTKPAGTAWGIRVGLHSGPVVAGVVGTRKFAFDIWGNTVNFAARMESSGVPGSVNVSERTHGLLRGLIETEFRGNVKIKEGRELPMYLARGPALEEHAFTEMYVREFNETPRCPLRMIS